MDGVVRLTLDRLCRRPHHEHVIVTTTDRRTSDPWPNVHLELDGPSELDGMG